MYKEVGITENITICLMFILPLFAFFKLAQEKFTEPAETALRNISIAKTTVKMSFRRSSHKK
jgi:hypothetical protein